jgi:hypothetical protein
LDGKAMHMHKMQRKRMQPQASFSPLQVAFRCFGPLAHSDANAAAELKGIQCIRFSAPSIQIVCNFCIVDHQIPIHPYHDPERHSFFPPAM